RFEAKPCSASPSPGMVSIRTWLSLPMVQTPGARDRVSNSSVEPERGEETMKTGRSKTGSGAASAAPAAGSPDSATIGNTGRRGAGRCGHGRAGHGRLADADAQDRVQADAVAQHDRRPLEIG